MNLAFYFIAEVWFWWSIEYKMIVIFFSVFYYKFVVFRFCSVARVSLIYDDQRTRKMILFFQCSPRSIRRTASLITSNKWLNQLVYILAVLCLYASAFTAIVSYYSVKPPLLKVMNCWYRYIVNHYHHGI